MQALYLWPQRAFHRGMAISQLHLKITLMQKTLHISLQSYVVYWIDHVHLKIAHCFNHEEVLFNEHNSDNVKRKDRQSDKECLIY